NSARNRKLSPTPRYAGWVPRQAVGRDRIRAVVRGAGRLAGETAAGISNHLSLPALGSAILSESTPRSGSMRRFAAVSGSLLLLLTSQFVPAGGEEQPAPAPARERGAAGRSRDPVQLTDEARAIHREAILIDGHNDLPWQFRKKRDLSFRTIDITRLQP